MAPRTRSQGIRPLPLLPIELKKEILSFCDPPTLANACLASLAFLELASPFLYQDITIRGFKQLSRLFYDRNPPSLAPHLDSFLSLSQLQGFTFSQLPQDSNWTTPFPTTRLSSSTPLRVKSLHFYYDDFSSRGPSEVAYTSELAQPVRPRFCLSLLRGGLQVSGTLHLVDGSQVVEHQASRSLKHPNNALHGHGALHPNPPSQLPHGHSGSVSPSGGSERDIVGPDGGGGGWEMGAWRGQERYVGAGLLPAGGGHSASSLEHRAGASLVEDYGPSLGRR